MPSPDLMISSQINLEFHRDPRVKPEDDIVGNFRIPKLEFPKKSKNSKLRILEFLRKKLEFLG